jgi:YHS domain-containing protein
LTKKGEKIMVKDPVCGMEVDPKKATEKSDYQGKSYFFCSAGCKKAFDNEPEKYAGKPEDSHSGHNH